MKFLKKVWYWLKYSSTNAEKISLTFKGIATMVIPFILYIANVYNLNLDNAKLSELIDALASVIMVVGGAIGAVMSVVGVLRKLFTTATGENQVIASFGKTKKRK